MSPVRARNLAAIFGAVAGAIFTLVTFFPGYLSGESLWQLQQGRSAAIGDFHAPLGTWLWSVIEGLFGGPGAIFVLQTLAFWTGLGILVRMTLRSAPLVFVLTLAIGLSPPVLSQLSTVWGVITAGSFFVLAIGLLVLAWQRKSRPALIAAAVALFLSCAFHGSALLVALPLFAWGGWISSQLFQIRRRGPWSNPWVHTAAVSAASVLLVAGTIQLLNGVIAGDRRYYPEQQVYLHDLAGLSVARGQVLIPQEAGTIGFDQLRERYSAQPASLYFWGGGPFNVVTAASSARELKRQWWREVRSAPGDYFGHRTRTFVRAIGGGGPACYPFHDGIDANGLGLTFEASAWNRGVMSVFDHLRNSVLFRGWFYFLGALIALIAALKIGRVEVSKNLFPAAALVSGMGLHAISQYFSAAACDFRLSWWYVTGAIALGLIAYSARWRRDWEPPRPAWLGSEVKGTPRGGPITASRSSRVSSGRGSSKKKKAKV